MEIYYGNLDKKNGAVLVLQGSIESSGKAKEYELRGEISNLEKPTTDYLTFALSELKSKEKKSSLNISQIPIINESVVWSQNKKDSNNNLIILSNQEKNKLTLKNKVKESKLIISKSEDSPNAGILLAGKENEVLGKFDLKNVSKKELKIDRIHFGLVLKPQYKYNEYLKNLKLYTNADLTNPIAKASTFDNKVRFKDFNLKIPAGKTSKLIIKADLPKIQGYIESNTIIIPMIQYVQTYEKNRKFEIQEGSSLICDTNLKFKNSVSNSAIADKDCTELNIGDALLINEEYLAIINKFLDEEKKENYQFIRGLFKSPINSSKEVNTNEILKLNAVGNFLVLKQSKPLIKTISLNQPLKEFETQNIYKFRVNSKANKNIDKEDRQTSIARIIFKIEGQLGGQEILNQLNNFQLLANGKEQESSHNLIKDEKGESYLVVDFKKSVNIDEQGKIFELNAYLNTQLENGDKLKIHIPSIKNTTQNTNIKIFINDKLEILTNNKISNLIKTDFIWSDLSSSNGSRFKIDSADWTHGFFLETLPSKIQIFNFKEVSKTDT